MLRNVKVIDQLKVLDNEVKLKILALLADTGAKSITDISRLLNLNFSTAHKYLEQLENAGFVKSRQETENRLKRMFYIQDFYINVSPRNVSKILRGETRGHGDEEYNTFSVITSDGTVENFDKSKFTKRYLDLGLPITTINNILLRIKPQLYNNITLLEVNELFLDSLKKQSEIITSSLAKFEGSEHETYFNFIRSKHPELINLHFNGDIFISNIIGDRLLNFSHDIYTIYTLGFNKRPTNLREFLEQLKSASLEINSSRTHLYDSFNSLLLPIVKNLSHSEIVSTIKKFVEQLRAYNLYISFDLGTPRFLANLTDTAEYSLDDTTTTAVYNLTNLLLPVLRTYKNIRIMFKIWPDYDLKKLELRPGEYIINMHPGWQTENAVYVDKSRFDSSWKYWNRTVRVGELQRININVPRLALKSKNKDEFISKLLDTVTISAKMFVDSYKYIKLNMPEVFLATTLMRSKGLYTHNDDSLQVVCFCGLNESLNHLNINNYETKKTIVDLCNTVLLKHAQGIRVGISGICDNHISERFAELDKSRNINLAGSYSTNVTNSLEEARLHHLFTGGHVVEIPAASFDINKMIDNEIGCVKLI